MRGNGKSAEKQLEGLAARSDESLLHQVAPRIRRTCMRAAIGAQKAISDNLVRHKRRLHHHHQPLIQHEMRGDG